MKGEAKGDDKIKKGETLCLSIPHSTVVFASAAKTPKNPRQPMQKIKVNRTQSDLLGPKTPWGPFFYALSFDRGPLVRRGVAEERLSSRRAIASAKAACRAVALVKAENLRFFASKTPRVLSFFVEFCGFLRLFFSRDFGPPCQNFPAASILLKENLQCWSN